jgi:two-component system LytT family response regulator
MKKINNSVEVYDKEKIVTLDIASIIRVQASGNYTILFTPDRKLITTGTINKILSIIDSDYFVRIHRAHAINKIYVTDVDQCSVTLSNGHKLNFSRRRQKEAFVLIYRNKYIHLCK